jgi:hypothetical protein
MADLIQMQTGGQAFKQDMVEFERSGRLYPQPYKTIVYHLYKNMGKYFKARDLAAQFFQGKKSDERKLRQIMEHAKQRGHKVVGDSMGYVMVEDFEILYEKTQTRLSACYKEIWTLNRQIKLCRKNNQLRMRLAAGIK